MIFVLLIIFLFYLFIFKQIKNKIIIYLLLSIWSFISVTIISCNPLLDKTQYCITKSYPLLPIQNDLDDSEMYYMINQDSITYYKINKSKIKAIPDSLTFVLQDSSYNNTVTETYKTHSICWRILTFDYSKKIVNSKLFIKE